MFNQLTALGYGLIGFAIVVGIGVVVLTRFSDSIAVCDTDYTYNLTLHKCVNASLEDPIDPTNSGWTNTNYLNAQLGQSGLAGWTPAIIALAVGVLFLGIFFARKGKGRVY